MKSRYSILLSSGIVLGVMFLANIFISENPPLTTDLFLFILFAGGYIATYTSDIGKSRVALISGICVSIVLIIYQLFINKSYSASLVALISFLIIPGVIMVIGGYIAKITKIQMDTFLNNLSFIKS
jgi:drug/metabolite transporter (DMT)-like permease